jgi:putative tryptophan/tyrosine transport system substrate-binding protein
MNGCCRRRDFVALLSAAALCIPAAAAQQPARIGFLSSRSAAESAPLIEAYRKGLNETGIIPDRDAVVEYAWAENNYDRLPAMAAELVRRRVAVIVAAGGPPSAFAAKAATSTIPIVFTSVGNPVEIGLVSSLSRPGGNVTGSDSTLTAELDAKRLELLHALLPAAAVIGILANPNRPDFDTQLQEIAKAARKLRVQTEILEAGTESEIEAAFAVLDRKGVKALLVAADPLFSSRKNQLIMLAARYSVPTLYQWRDFAVSGGLISYGASLADAYGQAGVYTARILKGANPAELPIALPTKFELVLNLKTAKSLGLDIPTAILARADEVIE